MKLCPACNTACFDSHRHCPSCGRDVSQVKPGDGDPFIGATFASKYKVTELIGVGAMGRVYRGHHILLDADVAIKLISPEVAGDAQAVKRFQTEARAASRLRHPNTIQTFDFGQSDSGALFLVMELLRGRTLAGIMEEEKTLSAKRIVDLLGQALSALDEAHAVGIVHRDFKPENVFVEMLRTGKEHVKVLDFGIAKLRGEAEANLTSRGAVCGTPEYMSPEQIRGEELDARSDVYAAGVVLYEMLTGARPFETSGPVIEILQAHLHTAPIPPSKRRSDEKVPRTLEEVCMKALVKNRDERYRSAADLRTALESALRGLSGERCKQCGMPLPGPVRFCPECGAVLRGPSGGEPPATEARDRKPTPTGLQLPLPLVGRDGILERLAGLEKEAMLLVGAPGVGKTTVIEALARREEARFRKAVVVDADPSGAAAPWHPLRRAVVQVLGLAERPSLKDIDRVCIDHPADRTGLIDLFSLAAPTLALDVRRREWKAAILGVLRRAGMTLVFEDVDRYDLPSRRVVTQLVISPGESTVLATAAQAEALDVEAEVLRLGALDTQAVDQLVSLGLPPGVAELCGGVPLAIVEWVQARIEKARDASTETRLEVLSPDARALLEAVAVAGGEHAPAFLQQTLGVDPSHTQELAQHGWLRRRSSHAGALGMASPTVRRRVLEAIDDERRRELHSKMAAALQARGEDPTVVAYHAYQSAEVSASETLERAGDSARERFDDDAAVQWYRAALERGRQALAAGSGDEARQVRVALKLGIVLRYRGDVIASEQVLRDALELASERKDRWAQVQARRALARLAAAWNQHDRAREHLVSAVQSALAGGDSVALGELYIEIGDSYLKEGDLDSAERELEEGLMLVTGGDGPEVDKAPEPVWRMLLDLGELARRRRDFQPALRFGKNSLRLAMSAQHPHARARAQSFCARIYEELGRGEDAVAARRAAVDELRRLGDRRGTAEMLLMLGEANGADRATVERWMREAAALAGDLGWDEGVLRSRNALLEP